MRAVKMAPMGSFAHMGNTDMVTGGKLRLVHRFDLPPTQLDFFMSGHSFDPPKIAVLR